MHVVRSVPIVTLAYHMVSILILCKHIMKALGNIDYTDETESDEFEQKLLLHQSDGGSWWVSPASIWQLSIQDGNREGDVQGHSSRNRVIMSRRSDQSSCWNGRTRLEENKYIENKPSRQRWLYSSSWWITRTVWGKLVEISQVLSNVVKYCLDTSIKTFVQWTRKKGMEFNANKYLQILIRYKNVNTV